MWESTVVDIPWRGRLSDQFQYSQTSFSWPSLPFDSFPGVFSGADSPEGRKSHGGRRDGRTNRRKVGEMSHSRSSIVVLNTEYWKRKRNKRREERGGCLRGYINIQGGEGGQRALRLVAGCGLLNSDPANSTISPPLSRTRPPFHRQIQSGWAKITIALASSLLASSRAVSPRSYAKSFRVLVLPEWVPSSDPVHTVRNAYGMAVCCVCSPC